VLDRYVKYEPNPREILACIVAMGTNMGLRKMAEVSGISQAVLQTTATDATPAATVKDANPDDQRPILQLSVTP
jgi:hypothetical protein